MLLQILGILFGLIGFLIKQPIVFIIGGFVCLGLDIFAFLKGTLKPLFPLLLYVIGFIILRSWKGILLGAIIGQVFEVALFPISMFWMNRIRKKGA